MQTHRPLAATVALLLLPIAPAGAADPSCGCRLVGAPIETGSTWSATAYRSQPSYGTPYAAYGAGERRPLDGSLRNNPPSYLSASPYPDTAFSRNWSGAYVGADLGYGWGDVETSGRLSRSLDPEGLVGGVHGGYNYQTGNFVFGLEGDATWSGIETGAKTGGWPRVTTSTDWLSSLRLRAGYATGDLLIFATGGLALGDFDFKFDGPGFDASQSETLLGIAIGGGVEYALSHNLTARVDALYYTFGDETLALPGGSLTTDMDALTLRAGLSFELN